MRAVSMTQSMINRSTLKSTNPMSYSMKKTNPIILALLAVTLIGAPVAYAKDGEVKAKTFLGIGIGGGRDHAEDDGSVEHANGDDKDRRNGIEVRGDVKSNDKDNKGTSRDRAVAEIDRRIASLNKLEARIDAMKRVSDASKVTIKATIDGQINVLTTLKAKIIKDTDEATLKADIASITKSYRIYMLVIPQGMVMATVDRINTTADLMTTFGTKLDARIVEAKNAGNNVTVLESASADYKAKIADAKVQASAALNFVVNLHPDNGDQATIDANKKAMTDAHAKIKAARADFEAARADARTIVKALKGFNITVEGKIKADR